MTGRGGSLVVSVLAFYSDDPSSNPAGYLNFLYEKTKINKKRPSLAHLRKNMPDDYQLVGYIIAASSTFSIRDGNKIKVRMNGVQNELSRVMSSIR